MCWTLQTLANLGVINTVKEHVVAAGAIELVCGLLEAYWETIPVVNAVSCFIANFCRSQRTRDGSQPSAVGATSANGAKIAIVAPDAKSFRCRFYDCTDGTARLVRVMFSHIDNIPVVEHLFGALSNMWIAGACGLGLGSYVNLELS